MVDDEKKKIMIKNFLIDLKNLLKYNFYDTTRGYFGILIIILYKIHVNWNKRNFIKNNSQIPKIFIEKNERIKVQPIYSSGKLFSKNTSDKNDEKLELNFKHIPYLSNFTHLFNKKNISSKEIEHEEFLKIKLAGIESAPNKECQTFLQNLFNDKRKSFYLQFNNIQLNDTIDVHAWILFKNRNGIFPGKHHNLNVILARNGFSKICNINSSNVYDENIFYYMSDLIDAENEAKIKGAGIWRDKRSKIVADYASNRGNFHSIRKRIAEAFKLKNWQKIVLKR